MMATLVDFIIPARNEVYLQKTIESVLANIRGDSGIIAVCDGYWPNPPIKDHPRVTLIHHTESIGQRASINEAARLSRAKFICKLDAHCCVSEGIDTILANDWQPGWTLIPTMFNLDHETWLPKRHKKTTSMYLTINEKGELRAEYYGSKQPKYDEPIHPTMACMGPCFFMDREEFWRLGGCDEEHGSWGAQSVEVSLKAWLSGGALMTDTNCYFAHWFRGDVGFPYPISGKQVAHARDYSKSLWLNDRWPQATRKLDWLVEKFDPPGWERHLDEAQRTTLQATFYKAVHLKGHDPHWRGVKVIKLPTDFLLYQEAIHERKPDYIVEVGTAYGGSALFLADMCELMGHGQVISIDIKPRAEVLPEHPRLTYLRGDSKSPEIIEQVKALVGDGSVMVILDGDHHRAQVKWELKLYSDIVTPGQYLVVEDCYGRQGERVGPGEARDWFLGWRKDYKQTDYDAQYLVGFTKGGWLLRQ